MPTASSLGSSNTWMPTGTAPLHCLKRSDPILMNLHNWREKTVGTHNAGVQPACQRLLVSRLSFVSGLRFEGLRPHLGDNANQNKLLFGRRQDWKGTLDEWRFLDQQPCLC